MHTLEMLKRILHREQALRGKRGSPELGDFTEAVDPQGPLKHPLKRVTDPETGFEHWVRRDSK